MTDASATTPADDGEAARKARWQSSGRRSTWPPPCLPPRSMRFPYRYRIEPCVARSAISAVKLALDDPYDALDDQPDLDAILRAIRDELKRGDVEHALLLIHYEIGDY